jgi:hypothetical protein
MTLWYQTPTLLLNLSQGLSKTLRHPILVIALPSHPNQLFCHFGFGGSRGGDDPFYLTIKSDGKLQPVIQDFAYSSFNQQLIAFCKKVNSIIGEIA